MTYSNTTGLPSPSDVLRPWVNSDWFTEESRERGTAVHEACAAYLAGDYHILPSQYKGYFESFLKWHEEEKPEVIMVEKRLVSKTYGYSGQPDLICRINSKKGVGVPDFKTGDALGKAWPIATAAYRILAEENIDRTLWGCSVRLREDGSYPLINYYKDFPLDFNKFLSALNLYNHFK